MATKEKAVRDMTDAQLAAEAEELGDTKRAIKAREVEIANEQALRREVALLSGPSRRIVAIALGGGIAPIGETNASTTGDER